MVRVPADEYAKFVEYQESLRTSKPSVAAIAESGNPSACLLSSSSKWVIDSGATDHMTGNSKLFSILTPHASASTVTLADGSPSNVIGSGTITHSPSLSLS